MILYGAIDYDDSLTGLRAFAVFAEEPEVGEKRTHCGDCLPVAVGVVESEVDVETIFPFAADDRRRLDFGEVEVVETEDGKHL